MKHIQGSFITGYTIVSVKGSYPEHFFQICSAYGIVVWDIKKLTNNDCIGKVKSNDLKKVKEIAEKEVLYPDIIVSFQNAKGIPSLFKKLINNKQLVIALCSSVLLVMFLSNILWNITIKGVSKDIEEEINKKLNSYGIHQGTWKFTLQTPKMIQQNLLNDIPELLWIGVHKQGTTITLEGVEKTIVDKQEQSGPRHLVAAKKGVIKKMYVEKGLPAVRVNDYVNEGDILVSGLITNENDESEDDLQKTYVASEGTITANTWYEIAVTVPLKESHEKLTGNYKESYHIKIANINIPIWGFKKPKYNDVHREVNEEAIRFLNWELPIKFLQTIFHEKVYNNSDRSIESARKLGLEQAKNELLLQLDKDTIITSEKILQEVTDSGKVKLLIYVTAEENIAKEEPITQGD